MDVLSLGENWGLKSERLNMDGGGAKGLLALAGVDDLQEILAAIGTVAAVFALTDGEPELLVGNPFFYDMVGADIRDDAGRQAILEAFGIIDGCKACQQKGALVEAEKRFDIEGVAGAWRMIFTPVFGGQAKPGRVVLTAIDISDVSDPGSIIADQGSRLKMMIDTAHDAIIVCSEDQIIRRYNDAAAKIFGWRPEEVIGQPLTMLLPKEVEAKHGAYVDNFAQSQIRSRNMHERLDVRAQRRNGEFFYAEISISRTDGPDGVHFTAILRDVTDKINLLHSLQKQAATDSLTGLKNRRDYYECLKHEIARASRHGHPLAVITLDIDNFKSINDNHGHLVGDKYLQLVADAIRAGTRDVDGCGRIGGEEFSIYLPYATIDQASDVAERIRRLISVAQVDGCPLCTASLGIARLRPDDTDDDMMARADQRLYEAKRGGKNKVVGPPA